MAAAQHKLSRRALLAGACAGAALPFPRHCERSEAIQTGVAACGLPRRCAPRNDGEWAKVLARFAQAEAGLEAVAHSEDDDLYGRALGRHNRRSPTCCGLRRPISPPSRASSSSSSGTARSSLAPPRPVLSGCGSTCVVWLLPLHRLQRSPSRAIAGEKFR